MSTGGRRCNDIQSLIEISKHCNIKMKSSSEYRQIVEGKKSIVLSSGDKQAPSNYRKGVENKGKCEEDDAEITKMTRTR